MVMLINLCYGYAYRFVLWLRLYGKVMDTADMGMDIDYGYSFEYGYGYRFVLWLRGLGLGLGLG